MKPSTLSHRFTVLLSALALIICTLTSNLAMASSIQMEVKPAQRVILAGEQQSLYVLITFQARELSASQQQQRPQLNLGLVLDRSGSMESHDKLEYTKVASCLLVDMLQPQDRLAVVEYDEEITVLWPSTPVEAPLMIKGLIRGLSPRGGTNLMGGLEAGVEQVREHLSSAGIHRVLLLSDGLANQGVTRPQAILHRVQEFRRQGITVTTLGVGLDYNEDLMQMIAKHAAGRYYYIENPAQMSRIFQQEMEFIFQTIARDVQLVYSPRGTASQEVEVIGYPAEQRDNGALEITLEDFYAGESRSMLLHLQVTADQGSLASLGDIKLSYFDLESGEEIQENVLLPVAISHDPLLVDASIDDSTTLETSLIAADAQLAEYVLMFEAGERNQALRVMGDLSEELITLSQMHDDSRIDVKMEALAIEVEQMEQVTPGTDAYRDFLKSSKQRSYFATRGEGSLHARGARDQGMQVEFLQQALADSGFYQGPIDGYFSTVVTEAVREFQKQKGLVEDGIAGPRTLQALGIY